MRNWKVWLWGFRILQLTAFLAALRLGWRFAETLFWTIAFSPKGMAMLLDANYSPRVVMIAGIAGGLVATTDFWSLCYYDLERYAVIAWVVRKFHKNRQTPPPKKQKRGWAAYCGIAGFCFYDVWLAIATAKAFGLCRWKTLGIALGVSGIRNFAIFLVFTQAHSLLRTHLNTMASILLIVFALWALFKKTSLFLKHHPAAYQPES